MTTNPLPDLSKWHEVPTDADIPRAVTVVVLRQDGTWFATSGQLSAKGRAPELRFFTAEPIPAPRPAPPTEPGTVLLDVTADGRTWGRMFNDGQPPYCWCAVDGPDGEVNTFPADDLVSWTVADVAPRKPDPLDENDHRARKMPSGLLTRRECGRWHLMEPHNGECPDSPRRHIARALTLADWASDGALRFADEVQS